LYCIAYVFFHSLGIDNNNNNNPGDLYYLGKKIIIMNVFVQRHKVVTSEALETEGVPSKRMNESGWVLERELLSTYPTMFYREVQVSSKITVLPLELCSKLQT